MSSPSISTDLRFGDAHELIKTLPDHSVDLILTDPPYGYTMAAWDELLDFEALWPEYRRVLRPGGACLIFSAQPFTSMLVASNPKEYRHSWYWLKNRPTGHLLTARQPLRLLEEICVFGTHAKSLLTYNPQMVEKEKPVKREARRCPSALYKNSSWTGKTEAPAITYTHSHPSHILEFAKDYKMLVPTQKPVALLEYLIKTYSNPGDHVLDPTMGSGSTGVAAKSLGRNFTGFELNETHFGYCQERINALSPSAS